MILMLYLKKDCYVPYGDLQTDGFYYMYHGEYILHRQNETAYRVSPAEDPSRENDCLTLSNGFICALIAADKAILMKIERDFKEEEHGI